MPKPTPRVNNPHLKAYMEGFDPPLETLKQAAEKLKVNYSTLVEINKPEYRSDGLALHYTLAKSLGISLDTWAADVLHT